MGMPFVAGLLGGVLIGAVVVGMFVAFGTVTINTTKEAAHDGKKKKQ
jgi:hypothetical protein